MDGGEGECVRAVKLFYLAEKYYDSEGEGFIYSPLFGECDDQGYATSYSPFSRVS